MKKTQSKFWIARNPMQTLLILIIILIPVGKLILSTPNPKIELDNFDKKEILSIQADTFILKGKIEPENSIFSIDGNPTPLDDKGQFSYEFKLSDEINNFNLKASVEEKFSLIIPENIVTLENITIKRLFTEDEMLQIEQDKLEADKKKEQEEIARTMRQEKELEDYYKTKAGKICKENPTWSKDECQKLSDNKIWIGMHFNMLKYTRGLPNSSNPSNYGSGTTWQWCWNDYTPNCFYGNDDGIVDSYN